MPPGPRKPPGTGLPETAAPAPPPRPTRGHGMLEGFLARRRMGAALSAIDPALHGTEILDIGCGSHPYFLLRAPFARKVGLDQLDPAGAIPGLELSRLSLEPGARLPFPDASFSCIASLAVLEHLDPEALPGLLAEIRRVLKPAGQLVLTTPHAFADGILRVLARIGMLSREEIEEHRSLFFRRHLRDLLSGAGFPAAKTRVRGFLLGFNILAVAEK